MLLALNAGKLLLCANILTRGNVYFKIKPPTMSCEQSRTCSKSGDLRNLGSREFYVIFLIALKRVLIVNA